jgi:hypothetical protein
VKERLARLGRALWSVVVAVCRAVAAWLRALAAALWRWVRAWGLRRGVRAKERERGEVFAGLGRMVYVLYTRSLVRNHDLLVECDKVHAINVEIDELWSKLDAVRTERGTSGEATPRVALMPAETDGAEQAAASHQT